MLDLVGNPEDWFSHNEAHIRLIFFFANIAEDKEASLVHDEVPLVENVNRLVTEGDEARNIEDAIAVMRYFTVNIMLTCLCL